MKKKSKPPYLYRLLRYYSNCLWYYILFPSGVEEDEFQKNYQMKKVIIVLSVILGIASLTSFEKEDNTQACLDMALKFQKLSNFASQSGDSNQLNLLIIQNNEDRAELGCQ